MSNSSFFELSLLVVLLVCFSIIPVILFLATSTLCRLAFSSLSLSSKSKEFSWFEKKFAGSNSRFFMEKRSCVLAWRVEEWNLGLIVLALWMLLLKFPLSSFSCFDVISAKKTFSFWFSSSSFFEKLASASVASFFRTSMQFSLFFEQK